MQPGGEQAWIGMSLPSPSCPTIVNALTYLDILDPNGSGSVMLKGHFTRTAKRDGFLQALARENAYKWETRYFSVTKPATAFLHHFGRNSDVTMKNVPVF